MQYLLLIYDNEKHWADIRETEAKQIIADYNAFTADLKAAGKLVGAHRLQPTTTATTVRVRAGTPQLTDGPFAETREQLGGYYLVEAANLDEATKLAARIPSAKFGSIEVRPIWAE